VSRTVVLIDRPSAANVPPPRASAEPATVCIDVPSPAATSTSAPPGSGPRTAQTTAARRKVRRTHARRVLPGGLHRYGDVPGLGRLAGKWLHAAQTAQRLTRLIDDLDLHSIDHPSAALARFRAVCAAKRERLLDGLDVKGFQSGPGPVRTPSAGDA